MDAGKAKSEIQDTGSRLSRFASGVTKVGLPIAALGAGVVKLGGGLLELAKGASEDDAAQRTLARTLKNTTGATTAQVSAVEDYIEKTGVATGITDDQMRPALANLVRSTKDVGKATSLMGLAMDISAGTGKDLGAVSVALAKAQNGSVGGLAKLGIATKDAAGKTKSFAEIQKDLTKTFGGQAAEAANSTAGKYARFRLVMDELGETIGGGVLPVLGFLANIALTKVFPAVSKMAEVFESRVVPKLREFGTFISTTVVPKIRELGAFITGTLVPALVTMGSFVAANADFFKPFVLALGSIVTGIKIWAIAQAGLNIVLAANPVGLVVIAIAALVAGVIYAYKHSDRFRGVVATLWGGLKTLGGFITGTVVPAIQRLAVGAVALAVTWFGKARQVIQENKPVLDRVRTAFGAVGTLIVQVGRWIGGTLVPAWARLTGAIAGAVLPILGRLAKVGFAGVVASVRSAIAIVGGLISIFARVVTGVAQAIPKIIGTVKGLPGKIKGAIGNLGSLLYNAGASLISGLANGMASRLGAVRDKAAQIAGAIKNFFPGSPVKDGPLRSWNNGGAGKQLADLLALGLEKGNAVTRAAASGLAGSVQTGFAVAIPQASAVATTAGVLVTPGGGVVVNVYALTAGPEVGRQVVDAISEYERVNGTLWRRNP